MSSQTNPWGGFDDVPDYPAVAAHLIKQQRLEHMIDKPVQLPYKKHKKKKNVDNMQQQQATEVLASPTPAAAPPHTTAPDLSQVQLPGHHRPKVRFAEPEQPVEVAPHQHKQPKDQQPGPEQHAQQDSKKGKRKQLGSEPPEQRDKPVSKKQKQQGSSAAVAAANSEAADAHGQHSSQSGKKSKQGCYGAAHQATQPPEPLDQQTQHRPGDADPAKQAGAAKKSKAAKPATGECLQSTLPDQAQGKQKVQDGNRLPADTAKAPAKPGKADNGTTQQEHRRAAAAVTGTDQAAQKVSAKRQQQQGAEQKQGAAAKQQGPGQQGAQVQPAAGGRAAGKGNDVLDKMRARLAGGRFRSLNEELYTCTGDKAFQMMQEDPSLFEHYHSGFQQQTAGWPQQPLELAAKWLSSRPQDLVVADFGCGEGRLATIVKQKVHSFDLVSAAPHVVACNMSQVPLASASVDVAVFSLALMGTDYGAFLVEAGRVLRHKGWLWIAEVRSRFAGDEAAGSSSGDKAKELQPFLKCLGKLGFNVVNLDVTSNTMFFVAVLRKVNVPSGDTSKIAWPALKACVYKKR